MSPPRRVLVIKLGALGDMVQADPAFRVIRRAHRDAAITLLTSEPYARLMGLAPHFDTVWDDGRPRDHAGWRRLVRRLRRARFQMIYDLQNNDRTRTLHFFLGPFPPKWSGVAPLCSHPHRGRDLTSHDCERLLDQVRSAGLDTSDQAPVPDLGWARDARAGRITADPKNFGLEGPFALLIPGSSPHRPEKRWPADRFLAVARASVKEGVRPVIVGGSAEKDLAMWFRQREERVVDLVGRTDLAQIAALAAHAQFFLGNDTGPSHLAAAGGAPGVVIFGAASDPRRHAPRGPGGVIVLHGDAIESVSLTDALQAVRGVDGFDRVCAAS